MTLLLGVVLGAILWELSYKVWEGWHERRYMKRLREQMDTHKRRR